MNSLQKLRDILLGVCDQVYHFEALKREGTYIVWGEDGSGDQLSADNAASETSITGTIELFTPEEYCETFTAIGKALKAAKISHRLNTATFESDTGVIHYTWDFEVSGADED